MTTSTELLSRKSTRHGIWRGVRGQCPSCGTAPLFRAYLKPITKCGRCGADFSHISADDGPSWLTILILGPFLVPLAFLVVQSGWPVFVSIPVLGGLMIGAVLLLLPRVKGGFIGALYVIQRVPDRRPSESNKDG